LRASPEAKKQPTARIFDNLRLSKEAEEEEAKARRLLSTIVDCRRRCEEERSASALVFDGSFVLLRSSIVDFTLVFFASFVNLRLTRDALRSEEAKPNEQTKEDKAPKAVDATNNKQKYDNNLKWIIMPNKG
jgi:hypothetical protein